MITTSEEDPPALHHRRAEPNCKFIYCGDKTWKKYQQKLWDQGWYPMKKKKGIAWLSPVEGHVTIHETPGDHRAMKNNISQARALGADV